MSRPMSRMVFVNLPVTDLDRATAFYEAIGFSINPQFTDDTAACVVVSDTIFFMILTREKFASFNVLPVGEPDRAVAAMTALSCDSREDVDTMADAALQAGGRQAKPAQDYGFMYSRMITDPDGNVLEPFFMDMAALATATAEAARQDDA